MTKEDFEQEVLRCLREQRQRYPAMEQEDIVKFVFQAMLGVGHLLSSRDAAEAYAAGEMERLPAGKAEPLYERLSPSWCRLNLRAAKAEGITPSVIAGLMFSSRDSRKFTRQDVLGFCAGLAAGDTGITDPDALKQITDETRLPSHSAAYREKYRPAYRVISAEWIPCTEAILRITARLKDTDRLTVAIDGPCASGKTTLAEKLAEVFNAAVIHTDDFVIPHPQKTAERLAVPGGNCDAERLVRETAAPWKRGEPVIYRRYDCRNDRLLPEERLPDSRILILEGSYSHLPAIREYTDVRIFTDASWETRKSRLLRRESAQSLQMFYDRWIPLEDQYFKAFGLPDRECAVLKTGTEEYEGETGSTL